MEHGLLQKHWVESVYSKIKNETRNREKRQKEHIEVSNIFKFGVYWAYIERGPAIQKLQNLTRNI